MLSTDVFELTIIFFQAECWGLKQWHFWGCTGTDPGAGSGPKEGSGAAPSENEALRKVLLLRPDIRADVVARGSIGNIEKAITDLKCRAVVGEHLVKDWMRKFQFGYGKWLRSWDEEVNNILDKRDNFS